MTDKTQKSAVEWYIESLQDLDLKFLQNEISLEVYNTSKIYLKEKAKEKFYLQIEKAFDIGRDSYCGAYAPSNSEEYYNETYGDNK